VNLNETEFIKIIDISNKNDLENIDIFCRKLLEENEKYREDIFEYSKKFDWKKRVQEYEGILKIY